MPSASVTLLAVRVIFWPRVTGLGVGDSDPMTGATFVASPVVVAVVLTPPSLSVARAKKRLVPALNARDEPVQVQPPAESVSLPRRVSEAISKVPLSLLSR